MLSTSYSAAAIPCVPQPAASDVRRRFWTPLRRKDLIRTTWNSQSPISLLTKAGHVRFCTSGPQDRLKQTPADFGHLSAHRHRMGAGVLPPRPCRRRASPQGCPEPHPFVAVGRKTARSSPYVSVRSISPEPEISYILLVLPPPPMRGQAPRNPADPATESRYLAAVSAHNNERNARVRRDSNGCASGAFQAQSGCQPPRWRLAAT